MPSASLVPCVKSVPPGWVRRRERRGTAGRVHAQRRGHCSGSGRAADSNLRHHGATETPSDQRGARRHERTDPGRSGAATTWYTTFEGGCVTAQFRSASDVDAALATQASSGIGFVTPLRSNRPSTSGRTGDSSSTRTARADRRNAARESYRDGPTHQVVAPIGAGVRLISLGPEDGRKPEACGHRGSSDCDDERDGDRATATRSAPATGATGSGTTARYSANMRHPHRPATIPRGIPTTSAGATIDGEPHDGRSNLPADEPEGLQYREILPSTSCRQQERVGERADGENGQDAPQEPGRGRDPLDAAHCSDLLRSRSRRRPCRPSFPSASGRVDGSTPARNVT